MLAAVLLVALEDSVVGREVYLSPGAAVEIGGKAVRDAKGGVWRVVGMAGDRYRVVADQPVRVGLFPAESGAIAGPLSTWIPCFMLRVRIGLFLW